jgi:hypothetical protein
MQTNLIVKSLLIKQVKSKIHLVCFLKSINKIVFQCKYVLFLCNLNKKLYICIFLNNIKYEKKFSYVGLYGDNRFLLFTTRRVDVLR